MSSDKHVRVYPDFRLCYDAHQAGADTTRALRGFLRTSPFSDSRAAFLPSRQCRALACSARRMCSFESKNAPDAKSSAGCWKSFCSSSLCSGSGMAVCVNKLGLQRTISDASHAEGGHSRAWYLCWHRWSAVSACPGMRDSPMSPTFALGEVEERCSRRCNAHRRGAISSNSRVGM